MSHPQDASTARGQQNRQWARDLIARLTTDPIAMAVAGRGVILPPPPLAFVTDAHGNPSERLDLDLYGKVMAERERLRRLAE